MLYLKEANLEDIQKEYDFITNTPADENGFTNPAAGCTLTEFETAILPGYLNAAKGIGLPEGWVPETDFFLWDADTIVGLFRIRHYLTPALADGGGHIGYAIRKECRGKGYASEGLRLAIQKAWEIIPEDEIYLSVCKDNPASLRVQRKNGAYLHHQDADHFYTRIKRPL
jgi:predicted acetyltransferase